MVNTVLSTDFEGLKLVKRGKVRDIYEVDNDHFLIVATDRISCFDVVLPTGIPNKGKVLNQLSCFWFGLLKEIIPNHFVSSDITHFDSLIKYKDELKGRAMVVKKARPLPLECVVRGYLVGSGWKEYKSSGSVCGIKLSIGLKESDELSVPIFTPAIKAEEGHDENIDFSRAKELVDGDLAERVRDTSIKLYKYAHDYAYDRGIIIADTKFEFGLIDDKITLIDEALTPDSSRFWPKSEYKPGSSQASFDKQFVRDYLESLDWDKNPPAPELPPQVVSMTEEKYRQALRLLAGKDIED